MCFGRTMKVLYKYIDRFANHLRYLVPNPVNADAREVLRIIKGHVVHQTAGSSRACL